MDILKIFLYLLVYPGLLFLFLYSTFVEWVDRKLYAKFQNRMGPMHTGSHGILQPIADFVKLMAKEDIVPKEADKKLFNAVPILALTSVLTAGLLLPVWHFSPTFQSATSFQGDIIVIAYLLSLPSFAYFLAGWASASMYAASGGVRVLCLLFAYEVPMFLAILSPAVMAGSWRMAEIAAYYQANPWHLLINIFAFAVAVITLQAKLERVPFDIPHAETEVVGGAFTEYSGRKLAMFRLLADIQMVVGAGMIAALFMGGFPGGLIPGFIWFIVKTLIVVFILSAMRAVTARLRIDQMISFSWKWLAPLALLQLVIVIFLKGYLQ
ncbi:TPA: NADH-quinone oxidoreductase subunit H [Candidatus Edwardsbacteria bacterium]|nr:NADH-quinone oxidoreductase subunit H [Candidatus Edwardsbacteria bacterium]